MEDVKDMAATQSQHTGQTEVKKYEEVMTALQGGWGDIFAESLISVIPDILDGCVANGVLTSDDSKNVRNLLWLFKAILKDEHGIDYGVY